MTPEGLIERHLKRRVKTHGGEFRKVRWIARNGAPDRLIWFKGVSAFVELKRPGKGLEPHQDREHERMRQGGMLVFVASTIEEVDRVVDGLIASSQD
jgi:hypothetical protein